VRILLDTNVLSEFRRPKPNRCVIENLLAFNPDNVYLSSITIGEFVFGIDRLPKSKKRSELERWLLGIEQMYAGRILPFDKETAHLWGQLMATAQSKGQTMSPQDGQIAATAIQHGLHLMTRNVSDFQATSVRLVNPWENLWAE
jgi:predicted nucleic acid-binding protein